MLFHRGFSAWLTCEGQEISEYETTVDATANKVTCWIPSQEGKPFVVHWRDHGGLVETATYLTMDGFVVPGQFLFGNGEAKREGVRVGDDIERPFVFQRIPEFAERTSCPNPKKAQEIGTVLIRIKRIKRAEPRPSNAPQNPPSVTRGRRAVGEPCIGFGAERPTHRRFEKTWKIEPYNPGERGPYVTFAFRYRSRDFLISQGIMSETDPEYRTQPRLVSQESLPVTPVDTSPIVNNSSLTPSPTRPMTVGRSISLGSSPYISDGSSPTHNHGGTLKRPICEESGQSAGSFRWFNLSQTDVG